MPRRLLCFGFVCFAIVSACKSPEPIFGSYEGSFDKPSKETPVSVSNKRQEIVAFATQYLGAKYKYASKGPKSFDCSGLVCTVFNHIGMELCAPSFQLPKYGQEIALNKAQKGDLAFFKKNGKIFHVSIIVSADKDELWVIHSTTSRGVIKEEILSSSYWKPKLHQIITYE